MPPQEAPFSAPPSADLRRNEGVARIFGVLSGLLEAQGENYFRARAYRRAARVVLELPEDIGSLAEAGTLTRLPGIGADLASKIREILETGTLGLYEDLRGQAPPILLELLAFPELSPRLAQFLHQHLGINDLEGLEQLVRSHMLRLVPEINKAAEESILRRIQALRETCYNRGDGLV